MEKDKIIEKFELLESCLVEVFEFYEQHGRFPWNVEAFLPQNHKANETTLIKPQ